MLTKPQPTSRLTQKISKRDLTILYGISYPTLRKRMREAGIEDFVGRRLFCVEEIIFIFKILGKPVLARTAATRLLDCYEQAAAQPTDKPEQHQDHLPDSPAEQDLPPTPLAKAQPLADAFARLWLLAIPLQAQRARHPLAIHHKKYKMRGVG